MKEQQDKIQRLESAVEQLQSQVRPASLEERVKTAASAAEHSGASSGK
jgi:hypothetical protein